LDQEFLNQWRRELLARSWEALETDQEHGKHSYFAVLHWRAKHPEATAAEMAVELSQQLGRSVTEASARQLLHRARVRFAELLRDEVARSLAGPTPEQLEEELRDLGLQAYCSPVSSHGGDSS
jgi:hypothetical protein